MEASRTRAAAPRSRVAMLFGALVLAGGLGACASVPPPTAQLAVARSSIDQASAQPITDPEGATALARARDEIAAANRALDQKDNTTARRMAELADADARLAMASARASSSRQAVADVQKSLDALRTEINRSGAAAQ